MKAHIMNVPLRKDIQLVKEFHELFGHPINKQGEEDTKTRQLRIKLIVEETEELADAGGVPRTLALMYLERLNQSGLLLMEEAQNIRERIEANFSDGLPVHREEELDAECDLQYVLNGKILTSGHHEHFDEAFKDVHESNMSKACDTYDEVLKTIEHYRSKGETKKITFVEKNGKYIVYREDGKILKSINYKPVDLSKYIKNDKG